MTPKKLSQQEKDRIGKSLVDRFKLDYPNSDVEVFVGDDLDKDGKPFIRVQVDGVVKPYA
jgi:hypothetical protein